MSPDLAGMISRVRRLREEMAGTAPTAGLFAEIEDVMTEGYARALTGGAWSTRTEERLHELISDTSVPVRGGDLRALAIDHARFQRDLIELRRELSELWRERDGLGTRLSASST